MCSYLISHFYQVVSAKCHNCNQWTQREGLDTDRCEHCSALLDEHRISYRKEKHKIKEKSEAESLLFIREHDSDRKKKIKRYAVIGRVLFFVLLFLIAAIAFLSHG